MSKKPSDARLAANRANAQKSTGPRTTMGKTISRGNALIHGLTGRIVFLNPTDREEYDYMVESIMEDLRPNGALELQIARNIVDDYWRVSRMRSIEDAMLSLNQPVELKPEDCIAVESDEPPSANPLEVLLDSAKIVRESSQAFANISLYGQRLQRAIKLAREDLRKLQKERAETEKRDMPSAIEHYKERKMRNLPFDAELDGFVFSIPEIEHAIYLTRRAGDIKIARDCHFNPAEYQKRDGPKAA